jgi:putative peptidoglycan lipid II flippase
MLKVKNQNLTNKILKSSFIIVLFTLFTSPLGYFVRMIFSRALSIEEYGLIYAVLSFFGMFTIVNDLGFGYAVSYFVPKLYRQKKFDLCWYLYKYDQIIETVTSIVISLALIAGNNWLSINFFKHQGSKDLVFLFSLYLIASGIVSSIQKLLVGLQKDKYYSSIELLRLGFTLIFSFLFFLFDIKDIRYYAFSFVFAYILVAIIFSILIRLKFNFLITPLKWRPNLFNKAFKYALPTFLTSSLYIFINHIDVLFLTYFQNVAVVGIYNIIFPIVSVSTLVLQPVGKMILPLVSELSEGKKDKLEILLNQLFKIAPFVGLYFGLFIFFFSKGLISMMFGFKWVKEAMIPLRVMSLAYILTLMNIYLTAVLNGLGEVRSRFKISLVLTFLSVILGAIGAKYWGILGVIFANSLVFLTSITLSYKVIKKSVEFKVPYKLYFKFFFIFVFVIILRTKMTYNPISIIEIFLIGILYTLFMVIVAIKLKVLDFKIFKTFLSDKKMKFNFLNKK